MMTGPRGLVYMLGRRCEAAARHEGKRGGLLPLKVVVTVMPVWMASAPVGTYASAVQDGTCT